MLSYVLVPFRPFLSQGITASVVIGSSTISNQLEAGSIIVRHIKSSPIFTFESVWSNEIHTQSLPRVCDDKHGREFSILVLVSIVNLTGTTVFDM